MDQSYEEDQYQFEEPEDNKSTEELMQKCKDEFNQEILITENIGNNELMSVN